MAGGKKTASTATTVYNGIQVQSAISGRAIPLGWGTFRCSGNLLWYGAFKATGVSSNQGGGKGGAPKATSYNYTASVVIGICAGPIAGVRTVYADQAVYVDNGDYVNGVYQSESGTALQQADLSLIPGSLGQDPWNYLELNFPDQAIGYSGIACAVAANLALDSSASLQNYSFEVQSGFTEAGWDDANPAAIINDFLPRLPFWSSGLIGDLSSYSDYCAAVGIRLSPVLDDQRTAQDFLTELMQATNSNCVWSGGQFKVVPYGDTAVGPWTPNLTPAFDLTDDDFIPSSLGDDPVQVDRTRGTDAYNYVQVEYLQRSNAYNTQIAIGIDPANIDQFGRLPNTSPYSLHSICDDAVAPLVAQLLVQRSANVRATYKFNLGPGKADLLEPMVDLVTLTSPSSDLDQVLVRLTRMQEKTGKDGPTYACEAEEMLVGTAHAAASTQGNWAGYTTDFNIAPGSVSDVALINPTRTLTNGDYELWLAAAGPGDDAWGGAQIWLSFDGGETYGYSGQDIEAPGRIGVTTTLLPVAADPDTADVLGVDLTSSDGVLLSGSQADADSGVTLCLVDDELISFASADLTGAFTYDVSYLRRGLYSSTIAAHAPGAAFIRLDASVAKVPYQAQQVGQTVHIKFLSYNVYGRAQQGLEDAEDYVAILNPGAAPVVDIISVDTQAVAGRPSSQVIDALDQAIVDIESVSDQATQLQSDVSATAQALLQQVNTLINLKTYLDGIAWVGQTPAKTAIENETTSRIDGDTAIVTVLNLIGAENDGGTAFVLNASTVQVSPGQSLADYTSGVTASIGANSSAISSEATTRASGDVTLATNITTLTSTVTGDVGALTASIASEATTRATADSAMASLVSLLGAQNGADTAFILNQSTVQIDPTTTLATYIAGVSSSLGANSAAVTSEASTRATADSSLASSISTVSSTVGGLSATVSSYSSAISGLEAQWTVSLNVNGNIAGLSLAGGGATSAFTIVASSLIFADSAGSLYSPFYVSGGVVYADSIVVSQLRAGVVTTDNLVGGAVTQIVTYFNNDSVAYGTTSQWIAGGTITTSGGRVQVIFNAGGNFSSGNSTISATNFELYCNGTLLRSVQGPAHGLGATATMYWVDFNGPGTYEYDVYAFVYNAAATYTADGPFLSLEEQKR